jgi:hypothetical protein
MAVLSYIPYSLTHIHRDILSATSFDVLGKLHQFFYFFIFLSYIPYSHTRTQRHSVSNVVGCARELHQISHPIYTYSPYIYHPIYTILIYTHVHRDFLSATSFEVLRN